MEKVPFRRAVFYSGVQNWSFYVALRFQQGNGENSQTAETGFVLVSHDITSDEASRGCEPNPLWGLSLSHTHRYDLITTTSLVSPCCPRPHQILSLSVTLTPYLPSHLPSLPHPSQAPLFPIREIQLSTRSQACWLRLSAAHWFQQSVSLLHPLKPARS